MTFWIVSYDIPSDKRRRKVAQTLEGFGRRSQYSVFECDLSDKKLEKLVKALKQHIDDEEDDIRLYPLNKADLERVRLLGKADLQRERDFYIV